MLDTATLHTNPWAITGDALEAMIAHGYDARAGNQAGPIAARRGRAISQSGTVTVRDGVATVNVCGPIFTAQRYAGSASYEGIAADVAVALRDPKITALILAIDSPGGELAGAASLVDTIYRARGRKRVVAIANDVASAAAYWLASAASEVVTTPTGILGSIGVSTIVRDTRERDAREGVETIDIISSQSPKKAPDPATEGGRAQIRATLNALTLVMAAGIARNRGTTRERVLEDFGRGGVLVGQAAVDAGLADRVSTYEELHRELSGRGRIVAPARTQQKSAQPTAPASRAREAARMPRQLTPSGLTRAQSDALAAHRSREAAERKRQAEAARKAAAEREERERPAREAARILEAFNTTRKR